MMQKTALPIALALLLCLAPFAARADVANGQRLAQQWCASSPVINGGAGARVPQGPPSFREMARHLDAGRMRTFLARPHGGMPDLALTRAEIEDLIAYIETFK